MATTEKTCTSCGDDWPADEEFFRVQPTPANPARLAPWCRACEAEKSAAARRARRDASAGLAADFARIFGGKMP